MAATGTIVITSSSPPPLRTLSVTPPSRQQRFQEPILSSPPLPSPSTFLKYKNTALKSGSRALPVPVGVTIGFASAASIWRAQELETQGENGVATIDNAIGQPSQEVEGNEAKRLKKAEGKLVKPKKPRVSKSTRREPEDHRPALAELSGRQVAQRKSTISDNGLRSDVYDLATELADDGAVASTKQVLVLPERDIDQSFKQNVPTHLEKSAKSAKKPRKRAAKPSNTETTVKAKKRHKQVTKSASIILNSDESEPQDLLDADRNESHGPTRIESLYFGVNDLETVPESKASLCGNDVDQTTAKKRDPTRSENDDNSKQVPEEQGESDSRSHYFGKSGATHSPPPASEVLPTEPGPSTAIDGVIGPVETELDHQVFEAAPRRRRHWTPIKDSCHASNVAITASRPTTAGSDMLNSPSAPRLHLADILGKFGYVTADTDAATDRTPAATSDQATKKRRIGVANSRAPKVAPEKRRKIDDKKAVTKSAKQPKKKAQTITALATAAFKPMNDKDGEQGIVSSFFLPREDSISTVALPTTGIVDANAVPPKPKRPRKSRLKKVVAEGDKHPTNVSLVEKTVKASKSKRMVVSRLNHVRTELYSPTRAAAQIKKQNFLFGTSSQLAPAESADFLREMQIALRNSEDTHLRHDDREELEFDAIRSSPLMISPQHRSCAKIATAPHGTCLSVRQTERELWCIAARDAAGGIFRDDRNCDIVNAEREDMHVIETNAVTETVVTRVFEAQGIADQKLAIVDVCSSPPVAQGPTENVLNPEPRTGGLHEQVSHHIPAQIETNAEDGWMVIHSDDSTAVPLQSEIVPPEIDTTRAPASPPISTGASVMHQLSPKIFRPVLHPLNSYTSMAKLPWPGITCSPGQTRDLSSTASNQSKSTTKSDDRPSMDANSTESTIPPVKKRGRPPKAPATTSSPPRSKLKSAKVTVSKPSSAHHSEWSNIDEISDSDAPPPTPSPPRVRATASAPAMQPLVLSPSGSQAQNAVATAPIAAASTIKPDAPQWPTIKASLFPRISTAVESVPRSGDPTRLSWREKILLYDPIVVEDLTVWLNERGLRVEVRRIKPGGKARKRKVDAGLEGDVKEVEWEVCRELLQPWMVQKWCEEMSICCFVRDGGWRGRR